MITAATSLQPYFLKVFKTPCSLNEEKMALTFFDKELKDFEII
jgi:hypothetical protein